ACRGRSRSAPSRTSTEQRHGPLALAGAVSPRVPHTGSPGARIDSPAGMMVRHRPGVGRGTGESLAGFGRAGEVRVSDGVCLAPGHGLCLDQWLRRGGVQQALEYLDGGPALLEGAEKDGWERPIESEVL